MVSQLSSYNSNSLSSTLFGVGVKQFKRSFPGGFNINFAHCLSASNDFKVKNYTNFYLTNNYKFSEIFEVGSQTLKANYIFGPISYGGDYLNFSPIDPTPYAVLGRYQESFNYGVPVFGETAQEFTIKLSDNNTCNIFYTKGYINYYLCMDITNKLVFVKETLLDLTNSSKKPQDFSYLYSKDTNFILLFKELESSTLFITKIANSLESVQITENNIESYIANPFKIYKSIYTDTDISLDTSYVTYDGDNNLNIDKSDLSQTNNFLLHRKYSDEDFKTDVLVLKNQVLQNGEFASANNLLSADNGAIYSNDLREYTSISQDICEENDDSLDLNYVFYNKSYKIIPGTNYFSSPSSMEPFTVLNINDTKFIDCGAFAYLTPEYADKIYHLSNDKQNYDGGQYLLCTWLSGNPIGGEKVWVDRYYYPDLVDKREALSLKPLYQTTYDNYIESLILQNSGLKESITTRKIFDKISDLAFIPNQKYRYDRIDFSNIPSLSSSISICNQINSAKPTNYFKKINKSGQFTLAFNFLGDEKNWTLQSDRNIVDNGLKIIKSENNITIEYYLYDATQSFYDTSEGSWIKKSTTTTFKSLKSNFLCVSIDSITGKGYFYLNDQVIYEFTIPIYQFLTKRLLYGDFYIINDENRADMLSSSIISNQYVTETYTDPGLAFVISITNTTSKIDDITITLPCGMRNSVDQIELINTICSSSSFKSNNINIIIKNLNISNQNILNGVKESITTSIKEVLPTNVNINNIIFQNFK